MLLSYNKHVQMSYTRFLFSSGFFFLEATFWKMKPSLSLLSVHTAAAEVTSFTARSTLTLLAGKFKTRGWCSKAITCGPVRDLVTGGSV